MTCAQCSYTGNDKTLYDKTVARRVETASRRSKRVASGILVLGLLTAGSGAAMTAAQAAPDFAGFTTAAVATPLRLEVQEKAIPIPSDPQFEMNFSYTRVNGTSGPTGSARASALWPGDAVGEGLKTFGEQLGLPEPLLVLTDGGYPAQINAASPGENASATQEFFPGNTGKVITNDKSATAKVGYGTSGDVAQGDTGDGTAPANPLDALTSGDLAALGGFLTGGSETAGPGEPPPSASPLGPLALLINAGGMESISSTTYDPAGDAVSATATSRLGSIALLAGLVKLTGVEVVSKVSSNIAGGAKITRDVNIGGMTIAGQKFAYTGDGFVATGKKTPIPGLPDDGVKALAMLGISIEPGKVVQTKDGATGKISAEGLRIGIDTKPLRALFPKLPLAELLADVEFPGQSSILKGLIIALGEAAPKISIVLGSSYAEASTIAGIDFPETPVDEVTVPPTDITGGETGGEVPIPGGPIDELPPVAGAETPTVSTPVNPLSDIPGLPPLGSTPMWMLLAGLALALGAGWYIRNAGSLLFGAASTCAHGLQAGIPDLRKA